jgi:hypothetical protein
LFNFCSPVYVNSQLFFVSCQLSILGHFVGFV